METDILVVGAAGSMGTRYRSILSYLKIPFYSIDPRSYEQFPGELSLAQPPKGKSAIICTRTFNHSVQIDELQELGYTNFLIEKPMFDREEDYAWALEQSKKFGSEIRMVCNYKFIDGPEGHTYYNYYHSGSEEKWSNLLQIVGIARGDLKIEHTSPIWKCAINGRELTLEDVHKSYILMIEQWLKDPTKLLGVEGALKWFRKARNYFE